MYRTGVVKQSRGYEDAIVGMDLLIFFLWRIQNAQITDQQTGSEYFLKHLLAFGRFAATASFIYQYHWRKADTGRPSPNL